MKQSLRRTALSLIAAALTALALSVPAGAATPARAELGLQNASLSCSDGTLLQLALGTSELTALANAVTAINLYPAGDPALACSLSQLTGLSFSAAASFSDSASGKGPQDFAVGGGQYVTNSCGIGNFSLSAHAPDDVTAAGTASGTYNNSQPATSTCGQGSLTAKVDCLQVTGNTAQVTALITHATGYYNGLAGFEAAVTVVDNNPDEITFDGGVTTSGPCDFQSVFFPLIPILRGNINVRDA